MPKFQFNFSARQKGAIGVPANFWLTVEADDYEAARLKLYDTHEHITVIRCAKLVTRYCLTHINKEGVRTLTCANQGRHHYDTQEAGEAALAAIMANNSREQLVSIYGEQAVGTFAVRPKDCYEHGDALGIYFPPEAGDKCPHGFFWYVEVESENPAHPIGSLDIECNDWCKYRININKE